MLDYDYVKEYMNAVLVKLKDYVRKVDGKDDSVMCNGYLPELEVSPVFNYTQLNYYQNLIVFLR